VITPCAATAEDPANAGIRREPELPEHEEIVARPRKRVQEFAPLDDEPDDEAQRQRIMQRNFSAATRQAPLDRADDLGMYARMRTKHTFRVPRAAGPRRQARGLRQS
jgi:type IV secretion system protein VirD4